MSLRHDLNQELTRLRGYASATATRVSLAGPQGIQLAIDFIAVDSLSCSFLQMEVFVPSLQNAAFDALRKWAENLTQRSTYLLEHIAPLELDPLAGQVLIRSTPPDQLPDGTQYYEIILSSHSGGNFSLRRFRSVKGQPGRDVVPVTVTHELLLKLADDLIATVP